MSAPRPAADDRAPVWPIVERRVIMVEQYRFGADTLFLEFPAGVLESGEAPAPAAATVAEVRRLICDGTIHHALAIAAWFLVEDTGPGKREGPA